MGPVQSNYAITAIVFLCLTAVSLAGDWLQTRRRKRQPDKIGLIPWSLLMTLSLLMTAVFTAFWLKER